LLFGQSAIRHASFTNSVSGAGRVGGKWETRDATHADWGAGIYAVNVSEKDEQFGNWIGLSAGREPGWTSLSQTESIPKGSKAVHVECVLKFISGTFDFDDIVVEFR
jgi:hypothetical protein